MSTGRSPHEDSDREAGTRLRVLCLIKGLGPGGAEQLLLGQARARHRRMFDYEIAYLVTRKSHLVPALTDLGVTVTNLRGDRSWDLRWALRLRGLLRREHFDIVHTHSPLVASLTRLVVRSLPRRSRPALVATEHNRWPRHARLTRWINRATIALDDADIAVSREVRESMGRRRADRVRVIRHGVAVADVLEQKSARSSIRAELGIADDEVVVGTVANFRREKAYDDLLEAAALAIASSPESPLRFVAVGQGPLEEHIRQRHRELGLGDRFVLTGYRDDAVRVMSAFDLFTLASHHEGLPVALMDALVLGLPVVATRVGGIPEAVDEGTEGLLVPPGAPDLLARAWLSLAHDAALRKRMGESAALRGTGFDETTTTRAIEAIYREVAAAHAVRRA